MNALLEFCDAMRQAGLVPPEVIEADGALHRFHVAGDRAGSRNGWYCLHLDGRAAGVFGSWKKGGSSTWKANGPRIQAAERDAFARQIAAQRRAADAERRREHEAGARRAALLWEKSDAADPHHPYLVAKHVKAHALRQSGAALIVPLFDAFRQFWNVQRILPNGGKWFRKGRAGGLYSPIGDLTNPTQILICEGWATGATLHEASGSPVLCAMNAGNLLPVAKAARTTWTGADLVICADNDWKTDGNPGLTAATAAAKATGAQLAVPLFPEGISGSDFNDLMNLRRTTR
jgi:putative DNA primase/helicase